MIDFSKVYTEPINRDFILARLQESDIFYNYHGSFKLGVVYSSKFRKDSTPSCGFYINKNGKLIYNDLKTGEKLDCFAFVAKLFALTYGEAIQRVAKDFGIIQSDSKLVYKPNPDFELDLDVKSKTIIQFSPKRWDDNNLLFWRKYDIVREELEKENVFPINELYINKKKIYGKDVQRYAYLERSNGEEFVKVYSPYDKQMKWLSNIPLYVPFGLKDLKFKTDTIIITKSKKDLIVCKKLFSDVIATQNESESALGFDVQDMLLSNYEHAIIFWDNDQTGVDNCKKFNEKGFGYFNIPKMEYEKFKIKDASDYVAYYGVDALADLFKEKGIL